MPQTSFDTYAEVYDTEFTFSPIGKMQRERVHHHLGAWIGKNTKVLEINCGTGEDARWLALQVKEVVATDISERMIDICRQKNIPGVRFEVCDSRHLSKHFPGSGFNVLFSDFGGLNCLSPEEIRNFGKEAAQCLSADGILLAVVMGRKCRWERLYFRLKRDQRYNRRQKKEGVETQIGKEHFLTWYYSPGEFSALLSHEFECITCKPIGYFIPPSYMGPFFKNKQWLLKLLYSMEKKLASNVSFFSDGADHYLIALKKKNAA